MRSLRPVPARYARYFEAEVAKLVDRIHLDIFRRAEGVRGIIDDVLIRKQDDGTGDAIAMVGQVSEYDEEHGIALPGARVARIEDLPKRVQRRTRRTA